MSTQHETTQILHDLTRWLNDEFARGAVMRFDLRLLAPDGGELNVYAMQGDAVSGKGVSAEGIAATLVRAAEREASIASGLVRFIVQVHGDGGEWNRARFVFMLRGSAPASPSTHAGALTMHDVVELVPRLVEASVRALSTERASLDAYRDRMFARDEKMAELRNAIDLRTIDAYEQFRDGKIERDMKIADHQFGQQLKMRALDEVFQFVPHLRAHLTGQPTPPLPGAPPTKQIPTNGTPAPTPAATDEPMTAATMTGRDLAELVGGQITLLFGVFSPPEIARLRDTLATDAGKAAYDALLASIEKRRASTASDLDVAGAFLAYQRANMSNATAGTVLFEIVGQKPDYAKSVFNDLVTAVPRLLALGIPAAPPSA